jgi:hypothetical protein
LPFDDVDGWRFHAVVINIPALFGPADMVEAHHRRHGGIPEATIRQLREGFGLDHAASRLPREFRGSARPAATPWRPPSSPPSPASEHCPRAPEPDGHSTAATSTDDP